MPRPGLNEIRSVGQPLSLFRWNVYFLDLPTLGVGAIAVSPALSARCLTSEVPKATGHVIDINIRGFQAHTPGYMKYPGQITLQFMEAMGSLELLQISMLIKTWRDNTWGAETGTQKKKSSLQGTIALVQLDANDNEVWSYMLYGCLLKDYDATGGSLGGTNEIMRPSITLAYDFWIDGPQFGLNLFDSTVGNVGRIASNLANGQISNKKA
jgi:hypothetical protein